MALQYSETIRNNQLDQVESTTGTAPKLQIRSGAPPASCASADTGTLLCEMTLPTDWMANASGGSKARLGTWSGTGDAGAGAGTTAGHFRVKNSGGTVTHVQGTITATGGGGDMTLDNTSVASGQSVSINTFTISAGNA